MKYIASKEEIAKRIRIACVEKGLTNTDLANKASLSYETLLNKLNGRTEWKLDETHKICLALGKDFKEIFLTQTLQKT